MNSPDPIAQFELEKRQRIAGLGKDDHLSALSLAWNIAAAKHNYTYNFTAFGRPIIQFPQEIVAIQELVWQVKPDLIIETGIAHGGSLVLSASLLALLDYCDAIEENRPIDPRCSRRKVLGVDIEIRAHNRIAIESHPFSCKIGMIEGSSVDPAVVARVAEIAKGYSNVMVFLDSNHTHDHVLSELEAYAPLVSVGSYCVVFDTVIEDLPKEMFPDRPWGPGNNPKTAALTFLRNNTNFQIDTCIQNKLQITVSPDGYLKRIR